MKRAAIQVAWNQRSMEVDGRAFSTGLTYNVRYKDLWLSRQSDAFVWGDVGSIPTVTGGGLVM